MNVPMRPGTHRFERKSASRRLLGAFRPAALLPPSPYFPNKWLYLPPLMILLGWLVPASAFATQVHVEPEGLYAHQMAHFFFAFSMGLLIYWLREHKLVGIPGWRCIQYSALFFILWNIDAMTVHFLDGRMDIIQVTYTGLRDMRIHAVNGSNGLELFYYFIKMDHLLCVPAMFFLWRGLRRLLREEENRMPGWRP